ncbi:hypothetical protein HNQ80_000126 [Anaerosolibacter carboniphilus]|uniref:Uncharacterized protein n=1 Tax=Anaerosolibacter carboniphilus TaxID=1417629 RepID=A0A841KKT9_9FIRM|nr:hypothetical protein [Anaerosolibacter carboniphilus]
MIFLKNSNLQTSVYTIGMLFVIIIASMNVLNYTVPKIISYFLLLVAGIHFFLLFTGKYK